MVPDERPLIETFELMTFVWSCLGRFLSDEEPLHVHNVLAEAEPDEEDGAVRNNSASLSNVHESPSAGQKNKLRNLQSCVSTDEINRETTHHLSAVILPALVDFL